MKRITKEWLNKTPEDGDNIRKKQKEEKEIDLTEKGPGNGLTDNPFLANYQLSRGI